MYHTLHTYLCGEKRLATLELADIGPEERGPAELPDDLCDSNCCICPLRCWWIVRWTELVLETGTETGITAGTFMEAGALPSGVCTRVYT